MSESSAMNGRYLLAWNHNASSARANAANHGSHFTALEEVSDGEFEQQRLIAGAFVERDAPLETQRTDRTEPAEPEADGVEQSERQLVLPVAEERLVLRERVSVVVEDDASDADLFENRELELGVEDELLVAADGELGDRRI